MGSSWPNLKGYTISPFVINLARHLQSSGQPRDTAKAVMSIQLPAVACPTPHAWPWCDPSTPLDARAESLLSALRDDELPGLLSNELFSGASPVDRL